MKTAVKFVIRIAAVGLVIAAFLGVPFCWLPCKLYGLLWGAALTLVFGRFFCDSLCPLGILQSAVNVVFHPKRHVRRVCSRLPESKAQISVRWTILSLSVIVGASGAMGAAYFITPYSVFGKAMSLWMPGVMLFAIVMLLSVFGHGRIWCNWICPYGTIFNLLSRFSPTKNRIGNGCANCRKCFGEQTREENANSSEEGVTRKATLQGFALIAAEKLTDGGLAEVTLPGRPARSMSVLPPGAGDRKRFELKCVGCQLCVANCPGECLVPSTRFATLGQPEMDFRKGYCRLICRKCGEVCPAGALHLLQPEMRPNVHMGLAVWKRDLCVRTTAGDECSACARKCPVQAIRIIEGVVVVDDVKCIGCGACEHVCPSRPMPAIQISGYETQRMVSKMNENDLIREMRTLVAKGRACVVARDGVITRQLDGRGIRPILDALSADAGIFNGAVAYDKVVGRAAAAVYVIGRASKVCADVMSTDAKKMLETNGIAAEAACVVKEIVNREKTGVCPMEQAVLGMSDPHEMVEAVKALVCR